MRAAGLARGQLPQIGARAWAGLGQGPPKGRACKGQGCREQVLQAGSWNAAAHVGHPGISGAQLIPCWGS